MNLFEFEGAEPLKAKETVPIRAPTVGPWRGGEILGFAAKTNREKNCMIAQERRWPDENGKQNYYRKLGGYSYDIPALEFLKKAGVERIVIQEVDNDRVLEFDLEQFLRGQDGGDVDGIQQLGVPNDQAIHTWSADEATIISASNQ